MSTALHRYGGRMRRDGVLLIAIGGSIGALVRYLVAEALPAASFPWPTFVVNIIGCVLLAVVTAPTRPKSQQRVLGTGFCGGLTTFSTFTVEVASMIDDGTIPLAILYLVASFVAGLAAFVAVRSATQPNSPPNRLSP